jgi:hypothetical protein
MHRHALRERQIQGRSTAAQLCRQRCCVTTCLVTSYSHSRQGPQLLTMHIPLCRYLVAQSDNTLRIINTSSMKVECSVYGVQPPPAGGLMGVPALQPGSASLALPAANAVLQFYDVARDQHVAKLQVGRAAGRSCCSVVLCREM